MRDKEREVAKYKRRKEKERDGDTLGGGGWGLGGCDVSSGSRSATCFKFIRFPHQRTPDETALLQWHRRD